MPYKHIVTGEISAEQVKPYRAKYPCECTKCDKGIQRGDVIAWARNGGGKRYHQNCQDPKNSPWIALPATPAPYERKPFYDTLDDTCANCGYRAGDHKGDDNSPNCPNKGNGAMYGYQPSVFCKQEHKPTPAPIPEAFEGDRQFDMQVPEDDTPTPAMPATPKSDGLLDLISSQVEAKVIDNVRKKVSTAIEAIDRNVKDKLDKLSIPSIEIKRPNLPDIKIHNVHKQFGEIASLLNAGEYVYLHGAPGGHKSSIGPQLAEALGVRYGFMSLCEQTPEYVVRGCVLVNGEFYLPPFIDFLENGGLWCWEEADNSNDNLRNSLNTLLEQKQVHLDNGKSFKINEKFYLVANGNTCGRGAHPAFPSRTAFDAAFAARFHFVEFEYDWELCRHIAVGLNKHAGPLVQWAEKVCNWALANGVQLVMSPREVYKLAKLHAITDIPYSKLLDGVLKGLDIPSKEKMLANFPFPQITRS